MARKPPSIRDLTRGPLETAPPPGPPPRKPKPAPKPPRHRAPTPRPKPQQSVVVKDRPPREPVKTGHKGLPPGFRIPSKREAQHARTEHIQREHRKRERLKLQRARRSLLTEKQKLALIDMAYPAHEGGFLSNAGKDLGSILRGLPGAGITVGSAVGHDLAAEFTSLRAPKHLRTYDEVVKPVGDYYKGRYIDPVTRKGLFGGLGEIAHEWYEQPVSGTLDVLPVVGTAARVASVGRGVGRTGSLGQAIRESSYPETPRLLTKNDFTVQVGQSRHPLTRWAQGVYDNYTHQHPKVLDKRIAKAGAKNLLQEKNRTVARMSPVTRDVGKMTFNPVENRALRLRLFWEAHLPEEYRGGVGLERIITDLHYQMGNPARTRRQRRQIQRRIDGVTAALKVRPTAAYQRALAGVEQLTGQRESILSEVFGADAEMFFSRRVRLAEHLGLEGDPGVYAPHAGGRMRKGGVSTPRPPTSGVVNPVTKAGAGLTHENKLERYFTGELFTDPDLIVQAWLKAQSIKHAHDVKQMLFELGEPMGPDGPKPGYYIVNPDAKPIPRDWLEAETNDAKIAPTIKEYVRRSIGDEHELGRMVEDAGGPEGLRQVSPQVVHQIYSRLGGGARDARGANVLAQGADLVNGIVRSSLLYLNPAYVPANFIGNMTFAALHQGAWAVPNMMEAGRIFARDKEQWDLINAETGHGATVSVAPEQMAGGARAVQTIRNTERHVARVIGGLPDNWPRASAFIHEANKAGLRDREGRMRLLTDPRLRGKLNEVSSRANNAMVDFNRLTAWERDGLAKVFFVWPWIRGATAWVGWYAKNYPERAGAITPISKIQDEENQSVLGNMPPWLEGAVPQGVKDGIATVLPTQAISPASTALGMGETVAGLLSGHPDRGRDIASMIQPLPVGVYNIAQAQDRYHQKVGYGAAAKDFAESISPASRLTQELLAGPSNKGLYRDRDRWDILGRRGLRFYPTRIDLATAHKLAEKDGASKTGVQRALKREKEYVQRIKKTNPKIKHTVLSRVEAIRRTKTLYEITADKVAKDMDVAKLTDRQRLEIKLDILLTVNKQAATHEAALREYVGTLRDGTTAMKKAHSSIERALGWNVLDAVSRALSKKATLERDREMTAAAAR